MLKDLQDLIRDDSSRRELYRCIVITTYDYDFGDDIYFVIYGGSKEIVDKISSAISRVYPCRYPVNESSVDCSNEEPSSLSLYDLCAFCDIVGHPVDTKEDITDDDEYCIYSFIKFGDGD